MPNPPKRIKAIQTAFSIIEYLKQANGATISEIARELEVAKSTAYCHLVTLDDVGYIDKRDGEYIIGHRFLDLGSFAREQSDIFREARPKIDTLANETQESAWLLVEDHGKGIYVYNATGERSVRTMSRIGLQSYLHQTAAGKCILAFSPQDKVDSIIAKHGLPGRTDDTITDRETLLGELEKIEEQRFALNREESLVGVHAVAAPVLDPDDGLLGAISVSGPANRLAGNRFENDLPNTVLGIANEIEINIAHSKES